MKYDNDPQIVSVEEYIAEREKEVSEKGERKPRIRPNINYTSFVLNEVEGVDLEYTDKNEVLKIKLSDSEGKEIKYGKEIHNDQEYTYEVTKLDEKNKDTLEKDVRDIVWCFWIPEIKEFTKEQARKFIATVNNTERQTDFLSGLTEDTAKMNAIKQHGVLYHKKEIIEKDGRKTAVLKVKFSKWLDGYTIKVEAYVSGPQGKGDTVVTRKLTATPKILEAYWLNAAGRKVTYAGYKQDVYLYLKTLGLQGQTIEARVFDQDMYPNPVPQTGTDDAVEWKNNTIKIEGREVIKQFKVGDKNRYKNAQQDEAKEDNPLLTLINFKEKITYNLELYLHIANSKTLKIEGAKPKYGRLNLIPEEKVVNAFFAETEQEDVQADAPLIEDEKTKKTKAPVTQVPYYKTLNDGVIGQKIQLVAECTNLEGKEVTFKIYEKEPLLVAKGKELPVLQNDTEVTEVKATVRDGFAAADIELQKVNQGSYNDWDDKLAPDTGDLKTSRLFIKVSCEDAEFPIVDRCFLDRNHKEFKLRAAIIVYDIYQNGNIEKLTCENPQKAIYNYQENDKTSHYLGRAKVHKTRRHTKKNVLSSKKGDDILLAFSKDIENYNSGNVKFKFATWNSKSNRWYINPDCFAGLLGAMIEEKIEDLGFNGFSIKNGNTAGGSSSHINGEKGDLRYLSINKNGERIVLQDNTFDYNRQVKFNKALYKYGWGNTAKMYSEKFDRKIKKEVLNPKTKKKEIEEITVSTLLPHTVHKKKTTGSTQYRHHHHIHLTGFDHSKIILK